MHSMFILKEKFISPLMIEYQSLDFHFSSTHESKGVALIVKHLIT